MAKDPGRTNLSGKSVVVTGGTTGIGRATAARLVEDGARVLIFGRHEQELNDALSAIRADGGSGQIHGLVADTVNLEDINKVFAEADKLFGGLDILVNNAAEAAQSILETEYEEIEYILKVNVLGYMTCAKQAIERMQKQGSGHIVNIGSLSAKLRDGGADIYVATKTAIEGFSESLRKQVNEKGIKVSLIEPGKVGADFPNSTPEEQPKLIAAGEQLMAEDIAECVHYCLIQPARCDVISVQIRPHKQSI